MTALLAALPIVLVVVLMVVVGWPASRAGLAGAAVALVIAIVGFGFGTDVLPEIGVARGLAGVAAEAGFTSVTILWIVLPALAIHHLQVSTGNTEVLRIALGRLSGDPLVLALLIGWFFALFVEGAAGFGASVALAAPFLVGVGYRPLEAVVVAMIGHTVGVSFGAIGTPIVPMAAASGLDPTDLAGASAIYHATFGIVPLVAMVLIASRGTGTRPTLTTWVWTALAAATFLVPMWALATFVGPELPTLGGSLLGGAAFVGALLLASRRQAAVSAGSAVATDPPPSDDFPVELGPLPHPVTDPPHDPWVEAGGERAAHSAPEVDAAPSATALLRAGAPYLVLIALVLLTRTVPAIAEPLERAELAWQLEGGFAGSFAPLTHPGTLLVAAFLGGALLQRVGGRAVRAALVTTLRQLVPVAIALIAMLLLARLMVRSEMTAALAEAAAASAGSAWPVLAPLVGVLGTFVTGSATASNVLFTDLQAATATRLDLPGLPLLGAQNFGAGVGNAVCPHNIVAAGATVGLVGAEGAVLRRTLGVTLGYALLGGLLALVLV
jgi:lactate permease